MSASLYMIYVTGVCSTGSISSGCKVFKDELPTVTGQSLPVVQLVHHPEHQKTVIASTRPKVKVKPDPQASITGVRAPQWAEMGWDALRWCTLLGSVPALELFSIKQFASHSHVMKCQRLLKRWRRGVSSVYIRFNSPKRIVCPWGLTNTFERIETLTAKLVLKSRPTWWEAGTLSPLSTTITLNP